MAKKTEKVVIDDGTEFENVIEKPVKVEKKKIVKHSKKSAKNNAALSRKATNLVVKRQVEELTDPIYEQIKTLCDVGKFQFIPFQGIEPAPLTSLLNLAIEELNVNGYVVQFHDNTPEIPNTSYWVISW